MTTESEGLDVDDLFREPEGYYQAEKAATFLQYELPSGYQFKLRLVGHNPLWVGEEVIVWGRTDTNQRWYRAIYCGTQAEW